MHRYCGRMYVLYGGIKIMSKNSGKNLPELLAPAGGRPHLTAAVNSGADAVYIGGTLFNARIFADNFREDELPAAIDYAHSHNVKVYVTLNTLIKDNELVRAFEYANSLYEMGADAILVQDMGLARLIHKYLPDFPMHLSTQGTLYNKQAVSLAKQLGFSRLVLARETSLDEMREISAECAKLGGVDTEVFVHGALCMCYSGQCQMSRVLGGGSGRTGNRGTCAQPCRQMYTDDRGEKGYFLSPKDICTIDSIPELVRSGVTSLKIEGRSKTPEYVATVTGVYRKYLDLYAQGKFDGVDEADMDDLRQAFNRGGFSKGYLLGNPGDDLLSGTSPKNQGVYSGRVVAVIDSEAKAQEHDEKIAARGALRRGEEPRLCAH